MADPYINYIQPETTVPSLTVPNTVWQPQLPQPLYIWPWVKAGECAKCGNPIWALTNLVDGKPPETHCSCKCFVAYRD